MPRSLVWLMLLTALSACANVPLTAAELTQTPQLVELTLADDHDKLVALSQWQGRPLLLFLFSTSDTASQLALTHLEHWLIHVRPVRVLGIALQPDARLFLAPYRDALSVSFPLMYDPQNQILPGRSDLGRCDVVPALVLLDAQGVERGRRYGVLTEPQLQSFVTSSLGL